MSDHQFFSYRSADKATKARYKEEIHAKGCGKHFEHEPVGRRYINRFGIPDPKEPVYKVGDIVFHWERLDDGLREVIRVVNCGRGYSCILKAEPERGLKQELSSDHSLEPAEYYEMRLDTRPEARVARRIERESDRASDPPPSYAPPPYAP